MLPLLRILGILPLFLAAKIRREERRLVDWLRGRGALDRSNAVTITGTGRVAIWVRQRLVRAGAVGEGDNGRYYLSEAGYTRYRARRRRRALIVVTVMIVGLGIAFYVGVIS